MERSKQEIYDGALAYEAYVGAKEAAAKPFKGIAKAEQEAFVASAKAVRADNTAAANARPSVDPMTGERLVYGAIEYDNVEVATRAGLVKASA